MAHAIVGYHGKCSRIHGHSYQLNITVKGNIAQTNKTGMMIDFKELKELIHRHIIEPFDHTLLLENRLEVRRWVEQMEDFTHNIVFLDFPPTAENILLLFVKKIERVLPPHITLYAVRLHETADSYVEWYRDDQ